jgi:hypothetical protein
MAEAVFASLLEEDGHVSFAKFEEFYNRFVLPPKNNHAAAPAPSKKKRALIDDDDDFEDDFVESPQRRAKKQPAPASAGKSGKMTKAVRNARLKSVISSLKASIKTKKFYGNQARSIECQAELGCSAEEFDELFGAVGTVEPNDKKTSKLIVKVFFP